MGTRSVTPRAVPRMTPLGATRGLMNARGDRGASTASNAVRASPGGEPAPPDAFAPGTLAQWALRREDWLTLGDCRLKLRSSPYALAPGDFFSASAGDFCSA